MAEEPWLDKAGGQIFVPDNVHYTCVQGQRRMLDFVVAIPQMGELMDIKAHEGGPWTPHLGLQISIHSWADVVMVRRVVRPRGLGEAMGPPRKSWTEFKEEAAEQVGDASGQANYWIRSGSSCPQLSAQFGLVSRAFEFQSLDVGLDGDGAFQNRHLGRGFPVRFVWGAVLAPNTPGHNMEA